MINSRPELGLKVRPKRYRLELYLILECLILSLSHGPNLMLLVCAEGQSRNYNIVSINTGYILCFVVYVLGVHVRGRMCRLVSGSRLSVASKFINLKDRESDRWHSRNYLIYFNTLSIKTYRVVS